MSILEFKKENLKVLHFFVKHLDFPVAVATYNEWEEHRYVILKSIMNVLKWIQNLYANGASIIESIIKSFIQSTKFSSLKIHTNIWSIYN